MSLSNVKSNIGFGFTVIVKELLVNSVISPLLSSTLANVYIKSPETVVSAIKFTELFEPLVEIVSSESPFML